MIETLLSTCRVVDLGRPLFDGVPQSPTHPAYRHALSMRHGEHVRADGGSSAADTITMGTHVGTHVDAVGHISQDGRLHGGLDAAEVQRSGRLTSLGVDTMDPVLCRGVLLDVAGDRDWPTAWEVTVDELEAAERRQGTPVRTGDAVLIRTGWGRTFDDPVAFLGHDTGTPGVGADGARWLAERGARIAGGETLAFEYLAPGAGFTTLPAHRVLLVEHCVNIVEVMDLTGLALSDVHEFAFVLSPLALEGATGSPVRPLALTFPT